MKIKFPFGLASILGILLLSSVAHSGAGGGGIVGNGKQANENIARPLPSPTPTVPPKVKTKGTPKVAPKASPAANPEHKS